MIYKTHICDPNLYSHLRNISCRAPHIKHKLIHVPHYYFFSSLKYLDTVFLNLNLNMQIIVQRHPNLKVCKENGRDRFHIYDQIYNHTFACTQVQNLNSFILLIFYTSAGANIFA